MGPASRTAAAHRCTALHSRCTSLHGPSTWLSAALWTNNFWRCSVAGRCEAKNQIMPEHSIVRGRRAGHLPLLRPLTGVPDSRAGVEAAGTGVPAWLPSRGSSVLLVTTSAALQDEIGRVAAAAAVALTVISTMEAAGAQWDAAAAVLIGIDSLGAGAVSSPRRRRGPTLLVGFSADREQLWRQAALSGADRVAAVPEASEWLAEFLSQLRDPAAEGFVLGVLGGSGGAGASTLAVLLAACAAAEGVRTLLVDGDEWGGGLEIAVCADEPAGLQWPDLLAAFGTINPDQLAAALPVVAGFSLLSWGRHGLVRGTEGEPAFTGTGTGAGAQVLRSARRGYELTVVDLGRNRDSLATLGGHCDQLLAVVPALLRPAVASARIVRELPPVPVALVVRGPLREGMDTDLIAEAVGCAVMAVMPVLRMATTATERGQLAEIAGSRPARKFAGAILSGLRGTPR